jgi:hypothetical protein
MYEIPAEAAFSGFTGWADSDAVRAIGFVLVPVTASGVAPAPCICMGPAGSAGGNPFVDPPIPDGATIQSVQIYADAEVYGIGLSYMVNGAVNQLAAHGDLTSCPVQNFTLSAGEMITGLNGTYDERLTSLVITTNRRISTAYGGATAETYFNFQTPPGATTIDIVGVAGRADQNGIYALGCIGREKGRAAPCTVPVYRFQNVPAGLNYYSTVDTAPTKPAGVGYTNMGISFHALSQQLIGSVPVYCFTNAISGEYYFGFTPPGAGGSLRQAPRSMCILRVITKRRPEAERSTPT